MRKTLQNFKPKLVNFSSRSSLAAATAWNVSPTIFYEWRFGVPLEVAFMATYLPSSFRYATG